MTQSYTLLMRFILSPFLNITATILDQYYNYLSKAIVSNSLIYAQHVTVQKVQFRAARRLEFLVQFC